MSAVVHAANLSFADHTFGALLGAAKAFCVVLFIYGVVSIFPAVVPGGWMQESVAMKGAAAVWPPVLRFLEGREWISLEHLRSADTTLVRREGPASKDVTPELEGLAVPISDDAKPQ